MNYLSEEVVEHIFGFVDSNRDRNNVSTVCKSWYEIERRSRRQVSIGNCYSVSPERVVARFPGLRSVSIKGRAGFAHSWIKVLSEECPGLEELKLKNSKVPSQCLELISRSFPNLKALVLSGCEGFHTSALCSVAMACINLRVLDLHDSEVNEGHSKWLLRCADNCPSLASLNFSCTTWGEKESNLLCLVDRCRNIKSLKLNRLVSIESLTRILAHTPQLVELGTGSLMVNDEQSEIVCNNLSNMLQKCKSVRSISGFWSAKPCSLRAFYPVCSNLTTLDLSRAPSTQEPDHIELIQRCTKLEKLWALDCIGDQGLAVIASTCKELQELRVFPTELGVAGIAYVTEEGLVSVSLGCKKLNSILYFCNQITNTALITIAEKCPHFTSFRLHILNRKKPDPVTNRPLDEGIGAIVRSCRDLRRLSVSGLLLTDQVFKYIGMYAERLEILSAACAGSSDKGMIYLLNGCGNLRKLVLRDCPFGDASLVEGGSKYETMQSLRMSFCNATVAGCKALSSNMPRLNVEIMPKFNARGMFLGNGEKVDEVYVYRSVAGRRWSESRSVRTL